MLIRWREQAERDLDQIIDYLLDRNPRAALSVRRAIQEHLALLAMHPGMGRPGRVPGTRELVIARSPHIVAYTVDTFADTVIILRVLHGARRWPDEL